MRSQGVLTTPTTAASPWIRNFDNITQTPWLYNPTNKQYISYDDPVSIGVKTNWAITQNLAGLFCWSVEMDNGELLALLPPVDLPPPPALQPPPRLLLLPPLLRLLSHPLLPLHLVLENVPVSLLGMLVPPITVVPKSHTMAIFTKLNGGLKVRHLLLMDLLGLLGLSSAPVERKNLLQDYNLI